MWLLFKIYRLINMKLYKIGEAVSDKLVRLCVFLYQTVNEHIACKNPLWGLSVDTKDNLSSVSRSAN